ncbi:MAG: thioredoxin domain-containing protein [Candidatus Izemoplasmatales bacterium]|nr:thioredoxin domain-containing protein [Candidatus Izemoplasmatales bacterium]
MKIIKVSALWCTSCLIMNSIYKKAFQDITDLNLIEYDYDENYEEVKNLNIGKIIPVIIIYKDDVEVRRVIGEVSYKELKKILTEISL